MTFIGLQSSIDIRIYFCKVNNQSPDNAGRPKLGQSKMDEKGKAKSLLFYELVRSHPTSVGWVGVHMGFSYMAAYAIMSFGCCMKDSCASFFCQCLSNLTLISQARHLQIGRRLLRYFPFWLSYQYLWFSRRSYFCSSKLCDVPPSRGCFSLGWGR